jgi:hypothetical protein
MNSDKISKIGYLTFWTVFCKMGYKAMQLQSKERNIVLLGMWQTIRIILPINRVKK